MKCTSKIAAITIASLLFCFIFSGCSNNYGRSGVADAYSVFDTSAEYGITATSSQTKTSLFASDLCVGGSENTYTDSVDSEYAGSAAVFCVSDEEITYAQNIYERRYPASTTKILTAYIALKYGNTDDLLTVSDEAINSLDPASSVCGLQPGDNITLEQALYGMMLCSGNDAANVIAEYISGSTEAFADLMNAEAESIGAVHSHFVNPHGLPDDDQYTTVYDLYLIFNKALSDERFLDYISADSFEAIYTDITGHTVDVTWDNTNGYISGEYEIPDNITVIGGKTGTTNAAGFCLALYSINSDEKPVISIVLLSDSKDHLYTYMSQLLTLFSN